MQSVTFSSSSSSSSQPSSSSSSTQIPDIAASKCGGLVCEILTPDETQRGTGYLIGTILLLTTHCVLPSVEVAGQSHARFFPLVPPISSNPEGERQMKPIHIPLDPGSFFFTSPSPIVDGQRQPAREGFLDITIVALKPFPSLSMVWDCLQPFFDAPVPELEAPICVIQHPENIESEEALNRNLRCFHGHIRQIEPYSMVHDAPVDPANSGGPIIDSQGRLIALHQSNFENVNRGILIHQIASTLSEHRETIERLGRRMVIGLPPSSPLFTGRKRELQELHTICLHRDKLVITGAGGVGKTRLAVHYATTHQEDYSLICFIPSGTKAQVESGLFHLADVLQIQKGELRVLSLKERLEGDQDKTLLIFDGVEDDETFAYLSQWLPAKGCTTLLVSSCLNPKRRGYDYHLPLEGLKRKDAGALFLEGVAGKDSNAKDAEMLAKELGELPLALTYAAAFIRSTEGYSFQKYIKQLRVLKNYLPKYIYFPEKSDETILLTAKMNIERIVARSRNSVAQDLLDLFSLLADAPIPKEMMKWLTFASEEHLQKAVSDLLRYALLEEREDCYVLQTSLQRVICRQLDMASKETLLQYLKPFLVWAASNENNLATRRHLDPYIPLLEAIVNLLRNSNLNEKDLLLNKLFNYYRDNKREESYQRINKIISEQIDLRTIGENLSQNSRNHRSGSRRWLKRSTETLTYDSRPLKILKLMLDKPNPMMANQSIGDTLAPLGTTEKAETDKQKASEIRDKTKAEPQEL